MNFIPRIIDSEDDYCGSVSRNVNHQQHSGDHNQDQSINTSINIGHSLLRFIGNELKEYIIQELLFIYYTKTTRDNQRIKEVERRKLKTKINIFIIKKEGNTFCFFSSLNFKWVVQIF